MIYVEYGNELEPLAQIGQFEMKQEVNGEFSLSLTSFNIPSNPAYNILKEEAIITADDYEFRVKQIKENRNSKAVIALSVFYDLNDKRQNSIYGGTRTFDEFATFIFGGTGWTFTTDMSTEYKLIPNFGEDNVIKLVQTLCQVFECEYEIKKGKHIHFSKQIGADNDAQYRWGHNIQTISHHVDTSNLKTYIEGFGAVSEGGGQVWASYTSPLASNPMIGKREAEPFRDEKYISASDLADHLKTILTDEPIVSIELDSVELVNRDLGERVWLIYEPLNMEIQSRIMSQTKKIVNGVIRTVQVTLGNHVPQTITDILVNQKIEIDNNRDITRSKFEQTNDHITMEVERVNKSIATLKLEADKFEVTINNKVDGMQSQWTQTANQIKGEIRDTNDNLASLNLELGRFETNISNRVDQTESKITQTNNYIELSVVKKSEYNGQDIVSKINMTPESVQISAKNINLNGATMVNGNITGNGTITGNTSIRVGTDLYVGSDIYMDYGNGRNNQIHFYPSTQIYNNYSDLFVQADSTLWLGGQYTNLQGQVSFRQAQSVDFTGVYVEGLNVSSVNGLNIRANWSSHNLNASQAGRLYIDSSRYARLYEG